MNHMSRNGCVKMTTLYSYCQYSRPNEWLPIQLDIRHQNTRVVSDWLLVDVLSRTSTLFWKQLKKPISGIVLQDIGIPTDWMVVWRFRTFDWWPTRKLLYECYVGNPIIALSCQDSRDSHRSDLNDGFGVRNFNQRHCCTGSYVETLLGILKPEHSQVAVALRAIILAFQPSFSSSTK
jgi:hypothetical protein